MRAKGRIFKAVLLMFVFPGVMGASAAFALTNVTSINFEDPAAAYNSKNNQYLVVALKKGHGSPDRQGALEGIITDAEGNPLEGPFVLDTYVSNDPCGPCTPMVDCFDDNAAVAYNSEDNEYVVVWEGQGREASSIQIPT